MNLQTHNIQALVWLVLRASAWLILAILLWWYLLPIVIVPFLQLSTELWLRQGFDHLYAQLQVQANGDWVINTRVLMPEQPSDPNKRHLLNLALKKAPENISLGLPILWALLLAVPQQRLKHLAIGTASMALAIVLLTGLWLSEKLISALTDGHSYYVFSNTHINTYLKPYYPWQAEMLGMSYSALLYCVVLFLPLALVYYLNRSWWSQGLGRVQAED